MTNRIKTVFIGLAKQFFRSPGSVFWTIAFPVMLILIFGAIFAGNEAGTYDLHVQDLDGTASSYEYIHVLGKIGVLSVHEVPAGTDIDEYIKGSSVQSLLIIPEGFEERLKSKEHVGLTLRQDGSSGSSVAVLTAVNAVNQGLNNILTGSETLITIEQESIMEEGLSFIDFFLPGIIGLMVMMIAVQSTVGYHTRFRNHGIFRKLATTPMTNVEWMTGMMLWILVMVAISVVVTMVTGMLVYGVVMSLNFLSIAIIVVSSGLFTATGIIISQFVKDEEVAGTAAGAITFPMMFLAGSFFPLESMPGYLQSFAQAMPLTYVNNGLRDAMIYGNSAGAMDNLLVILVMMLVVTVVTVAISGWRKE